MAAAVSQVLMALAAGVQTLNLFNLLPRLVELVSSLVMPVFLGSTAGLWLITVSRFRWGTKSVKAAWEAAARANALATEAVAAAKKSNEMAERAINIAVVGLRNSGAGLAVCLDGDVSCIQSDLTGILRLVVYNSSGERPRFSHIHANSILVAGFPVDPLSEDLRFVFEPPFDGGAAVGDGPVWAKIRFRVAEPVARASSVAVRISGMQILLSVHEGDPPGYAPLKDVSGSIAVRQLGTATARAPT